MSEQTPDSVQGEEKEESPQTDSYPARDADNGEEQKNRLGYMVTEPTEEEIEGDESEED